MKTNTLKSTFIILITASSIVAKSSEAPLEKVMISVINPDQVRSEIRQRMPQFRYCYQSLIDTEKSNSDFSKYTGVANLKFQIEYDGYATNTEITTEIEKSDALISCLTSVLKGIQFPRPLGGKTVTVVQPIRFFPKKI